MSTDQSAVENVPSGSPVVVGQQFEGVVFEFLKDTFKLLYENPVLRSLAERERDAPHPHVVTGGLNRRGVGDGSEDMA